MKGNSATIERNDSSVTKKKPRKPQPPSRYKVIYHNDDFTPMEFVSWSLRAFFNKDEMEANSIMLEVHKLGNAIAGIYDFQTAETKIYEVMTSAKENEFPLKVTGEAE